MTTLSERFKRKLEDYYANCPFKWDYVDAYDDGFDGEFEEIDPVQLELDRNTKNRIECLLFNRARLDEHYKWRYAHVSIDEYGYISIFKYKPKFIDTFRYITERKLQYVYEFD